MSRTDAHVPIHIRIARGDLAATAHHDHASGECDLPPRHDVAHDWRPVTRCQWRFAFTGIYVCSCEMCHEGRAHRAERRRSRHTATSDARLAVRRWNTGDRTLE
ncbi:hypothetical protein GCM10022219_20770 [Microbacterium oryzae]|uniref:Uncharacterized protein n=1 Tax=Microbacterium oryzae TaxID=743009 RepID=A0A6I6E5I2_9MICO|nr:hypothetical protein [Microbacterium oryzae]QGU27680.1 hypothetical protein D7D94_08355 [Microbacterium oryzae]